MYLTYSNNPYGEGTGTTPVDTVIVFTYQTIIHKKDERNADLTGATFTLEKEIKGETENRWETVGTVTGTDTSVFTFTGLDDGNYRLTETKAPDGYNTMEPVLFTVTATHDTDTDSDGVHNLSELTGNVEDGVIQFTPDVTQVLSPPIFRTSRAAFFRVPAAWEQPSSISWVLPLWQGLRQSLRYGSKRPGDNRSESRQIYMKKHLSTVLLVLVLAAGISLLLYPSISGWRNGKIQSRTIEEYRESVAGLSEEDDTELFQAAERYNRQLREKGESAFHNPELVSGYEDALDVSGTGVMGYVTIGKLEIELPIYHGTSPEVLQIAAGHLEGSSLPVGGAGTHSVISAHRGLPSSRLFTDLDQLKKGDTFTITVLNRQLTYQVDQILVVEPDETDALQIEPDRDYCTLMTCTPYGINSHRLLVRGVRMENQGISAENIAGDARKIRPFTAGTAVVLPFAAATGILILNHIRKRKK